MTLEEYFGDWLKVIDMKELNKIVSQMNYLYKKLPIVPAYQDVFKAFTLCLEKDCKVIFIGQDPYPQKDVATGVLFGNKPDTKILSPSLKVIENSVVSLCDNDMPFSSFDITMESWGKQGILLINAAFTCILNKIGSHMNMWRPFVSSFLQNMSKAETGIIYVLWGAQAQSFKPYINQKLNYVLEEKHPAFYARTNSSMPNDIFIKINTLLTEMYGTSIKWCID